MTCEKMGADMNKRHGFTLIELMLVVVIIGALAAMVVPRFAGRSERAKISVAKADVYANIAAGLDLYELDNGRYPSDLQALIANPGGLTYWNGPYIKKKAIDPWGQEYQYRYPSAHDKDYDLYSLGPDRSAGGDDDVVSWE